MFGQFLEKITAVFIHHEGTKNHEGNFGRGKRKVKNEKSNSLFTDHF